MERKENLLKMLNNYTSEEIEEVLRLKKSQNILKARPDKDSNYFYIKVDGGTSQTMWKGGKSDEGRFMLGNYFTSRKEAEFDLEKRKVNNELKRLAKYFNDPEKLAYDYIMENGAYTLYLDVTTNKDARIIVMKKNFTQIGFNTYIEMGLALFTDKESAEKAIEIIGPQRIGDYLFNLKGE